MKLVITIDTEEDEWGRYSPRSMEVDNILHLPALQDVFDEFEAIPTYLITYPVATNPKAVSVLNNLNQGGRCEIGAHCHPWNTPPFRETPNPRNSMLCNLPSELQYLKLETLHEAIQRHLGITPVSFRCGRWGYSSSVASQLRRLGYRVESSITPFTNWSPHHGPDFTPIGPESFRFGPGDAFSPSVTGDMVEIPATIGFLNRDFHRSNAVQTLLERPAWKRWRVLGVLERLNLLKKVWLSPEKADARNMIALAERMSRNRYPVLNMVFHSPTLVPGLTPFVRTAAEQREFMKRIKTFLSFARRAGIKPARLADAF